MTRYYHRYQRKEKRRKRAKRILAAVFTICLTCLSVFTIQKIPAGEVYAATDKDAVYWPKHSDMGTALGEPAQIDAEELLAWIEENAIPVVFVDAGHGGADAGCSRAGVEEKTINLEIALKVQEQLEELDAEGKKVKRNIASIKNMFLTWSAVDGGRKLTEGMVNSCIERIDVFPDKRLEVKLRYHDCFDLLEKGVEGEKEA